ncbi:MAG: aminotransferase class I/II-fold pyridoxal phosphate-dependent enzyme [Saprospiraceae bacterium]
MANKFKIDTQCVLEYDDKLHTNPHILPIYATSSFDMGTFEQGMEIFKGQKEGHVYGRYGNPTIDLTAQKIANLEGFGLHTEAYAFMTSSGMSAITVLLQTLFEKGGTIITQEDLYGGTTELFKSVFTRFGISTIFMNLSDTESLEDILKSSQTPTVVYVETPSNPLCNCIDLSIIASVCSGHGAISIVDNTFCTPLIQQPFLHGIDFVIHSTTKYLNGHGNSIAGVIVGWKEEYKKAIWNVLKLTGATCNPFDAWLVYNGLKTLGLRLERHSQNAGKLAAFLNNHIGVETVNYTGLEHHPSFKIAQKQMKLHGGMLSFEVKGGKNAAGKLMNQLKLATYTPTLGDVNTLVLHPRTSSHLNVDSSICEKNGITEGLIRVSVGIENVSDIIQDFEVALNHI